MKGHKDYLYTYYNAHLCKCVVHKCISYIGRSHENSYIFQNKVSIKNIKHRVVKDHMHKHGHVKKKS